MLFRKKIDRFCSYCVYAGKLDDETYLCAKRGFVAACHHCRKFKYDPLIGRTCFVLSGKNCTEKDARTVSFTLFLQDFRSVGVFGLVIHGSLFTCLLRYE